MAKFFRREWKMGDVLSGGVPRGTMPADVLQDRPIRRSDTSGGRRHGRNAGREEGLKDMDNKMDGRSTGEQDRNRGRSGAVCGKESAGKEMRVHHRVSYQIRRRIRLTKEYAGITAAFAAVYIGLVLQSTDIPEPVPLSERIPELTAGGTLFALAAVTWLATRYLERRAKK